jgi:hypothetical protein
MRTKIRPTAVLLAALLAAGSAQAHHRQTAAVVQFTTAGDNTLPRIASFNGSLVLSVGDTGARDILKYRYPWQSSRVVVGTGGDNADPASAIDGSVVAWDSDGNLLGLGDPGRQIYVRKGALLQQVSHDPSGTSANPTANSGASVIAWESTGDMVGNGNAGVQQVFMSSRTLGLKQVSSGLGTSGNPTLNRTGSVLVFQSTSDPVTGADTGVSQLWVANLKTGGAAPITSGLGSSSGPAISPDGRVLVFQSTADLSGDGSDTGVPQVFAYDIRYGSFAQITADPGGCTEPTIHKFRHDFRIPFLCQGQVYFYLLRDDQRFHVVLPGDTSSVTAGPGFQFLMVTTTADLLSTGPTGGRQIYLLNQFKTPGVLVSGKAVWFPTRSIPPSH